MKVLLINGSPKEHGNTFQALSEVANHIEAATITPEVNSNSVFCTRGDISSFIKKTKDEPNIVPSSGINSPMINVVAIYVP